MVKVRIYIEGGGDGKNGRDRMREGFGQFFENALGRQPITVVPCGSRDTTLRDFKNALNSHPEAFNILLVDSEAPVSAKHTPWAHLKKRDKAWEKPPSLDEEQVHLMVQTMEAWFIADRDALRNYYGQGFKENAIPKNSNVEDIPKAKLEPALKEASKSTTKKEYHKINHGYKLLAKIDPQKVSKASKYCKRLLEPEYSNRLFYRRSHLRCDN